MAVAASPPVIASEPSDLLEPPLLDDCEDGFSSLPAEADAFESELADASVFAAGSAFAEAEADAAAFTFADGSVDAEASAVASNSIDASTD
ncbi:hypothetical protein, partial [Microbacterium sp. NPDC090003]|uniref:hypothetical protein n=1 Tax=Microbacterium sp. NPDC090003 TaxID=3364203 RepID=UPI0038013E3A